MLKELRKEEETLRRCSLPRALGQSNYEPSDALLELEANFNDDHGPLAGEEELIARLRVTADAPLGLSTVDTIRFVIKKIT